jgi:hypothetical protein
VADIAWTTILTPEGSIAPGDTVSAGDLGDNGEEELEQLRLAGAVRETDYPEDINPNESVRERNIRVVNEKMEEVQDAEYDMPELVQADFSVLGPVSAEQAKEMEEAAKLSNQQTGASEVTPPKRTAAKSSE